MSKNQDRVVVVGAGLMGTGIAAGFMAHGVDTVLLSRDGDLDGAARRRTMALAQNLSSGQDDGALPAATIDSFSDWSGVVLVIE